MNYDLYLPPAKEPVTDLFYLIVDHEDSLYDPPDGRRSFVSEPEKNDGFVYCELLDGKDGGALNEKARTKREEVFDCSISRQHITSKCWKAFDLKLGEMHPRGELVWPVSENLSGELVLMKASLAAELTRKFRGLELFDSVRGFGIIKGEGRTLQLLPGALNEYRIPHGTGRLRHRGLAIQGRPSQCPFCAFEITECPDCGAGGWNEYKCPQCKEFMFRVESQKLKGPSDRRLLASPHKQRPCSVWNGETWDGSDFIACWLSVAMMVTKRVVDCMLATHATSFRAVPVIVDAEKMTPQQRKLMDEARKMPV